MHHMTRAQMSRQNGGFSAIFISQNQLHDLMHLLLDLDLTPCPPEGLPIHRVCQICVYIVGCFAMCSTGNQSKSGKKNQTF